VPVTHKLKRQFPRDRLERDLRQDFPETPVTRGWTGNVKVRARFDIVVVFRITRTKAHIHATHPLLYALGFGGGSFGYGEDEKRSFENKFARWFSDRYPDHLLVPP